MYNFLQYQLEIGICLLFFYSVYYFILRNSTFFKLNRCYLLCALVISIIIPTLSFNVPIGTEFDFSLNSIPAFITSIESVPSISDNSNIDISVDNDINLLRFFIVFYISGVVIFFINFLYSLIKLSRLLFGSKILHYNGLRIIHNNNENLIFSFLGYIFINPEEFDNEDLSSLITHEKIHVSQYHFLDLIIVEIIKMFQWFNPAIYFYKSSIQEIHEFLADAGVVNEGYDVPNYQKLLFKQTINIQFVNISNGINSSLTKRRLKMMLKDHSSRLALYKYLTIFPVTLLLILFFSCESLVEKKDTMELEKIEALNIIDGEVKSDEATWNDSLWVATGFYLKHKCGVEIDAKHIEIDRIMNIFKSEQLNGRILMTNVVEIIIKKDDDFKYSADKIIKSDDNLRLIGNATISTQDIKIKAEEFSVKIIH